MTHGDSDHLGSAERLRSEHGVPELSRERGGARPARRRRLRRGRPDHRHVLTGREGPQPAPFTDDPDEALDSLDRIAPPRHTLGAPHRPRRATRSARGRATSAEP
ncbi:hypothetical protein [Nonomuraea sp. NPDC005701]|uniref:hypothetical protein n=1 Tax=Nonomuraea sp. NPDC005701 TaxID=3157049 RepID=UPI0033C28910